MKGGGVRDNGEMKRTRASTRLGYNERHAKSGLTASLPAIETFPNQYKGYEITIEIPEYTAICPKTSLPDFGIITVHYMPDRECLELKSLENVHPCVPQHRHFLRERGE